MTGTPGKQANTFKVSRMPSLWTWNSRKLWAVGTLFCCWWWMKAFLYFNYFSPHTVYHIPSCSEIYICVCTTICEMELSRGQTSFTQIREIRERATVTVNDMFFFLLLNNKQFQVFNTLSLAPPTTFGYWISGTFRIIISSSWLYSLCCGLFW